jgi:hypothetical protein
MKIIFLLLSFFCFTIFVAFSSSFGTENTVVIMPGTFYFSINGNIQNGVNLSGLKPASPTTYQVGYWILDKNSDFLYYYDSSEVPGFRIQMYLNGDFEYSGSYPDQGNIPLSRFSVFSEWDNVSQEGKIPTIGLDSSMATLNINSYNSCLPFGETNYSDFYDFNNDFYSYPYSKYFVSEPFDYLISRNSCKNEGKIYMGRFFLDLGIVKAGEYKSSLYILMLDGY